MSFVPASIARRAALPVLLSLLVTPALAQPPRSHAADPVVQGADAYARGDLKGAHEAYLAALHEAPRSFTVLHRLARVEAELAEDAPGEEARQLTAAAIEHAREAIRIAPDSAAGHLELAAALGRQALKEGPKTQLSLSREIKSEVDRSLAIEPGRGRAWHVLAIWNRRLASLNMVERAVARTLLGGVPKGASMDNAVADLQKAVELEPAYVNHRLELGRTLLQLGRRGDARRELEKAVALPPTSNPRDPHYQAQARVLLAKLGKG